MESVEANISNGLFVGREKKLRKKTEKCVFVGKKEGGKLLLYLFI